MHKAFITVTPDTGQNNGTLSVNADKNENYVSRYATFKVEGGGITRSVSVEQRPQVPTPIIKVGFDFTQSYSNTTINESNSFIDWTTYCLLPAVPPNETGEISVGNLKNFSGFIDIDNSLRIDSISINTDITSVSNIHNWTFTSDQSSYDIKNDILVLTQDAYYEIVEYIKIMFQTASGVFTIRVMSMTIQRTLELTIFIDD